MKHEEESNKGQGSPTQNFQITNVSNKSERFHILELHTPILGSGMGLVLTTIFIMAIFLVYRKYRKRLLKVKQLQEYAK